MAVRMTGTIVGKAPVNGQWMQITLQLFPPASTAPFYLMTGSATVVNALSIGQTVPVYIAVTGAEQTAIEGVVTVNPIDVND